MTQNIYFEPAWERTISDPDRKVILEKFYRLKEANVANDFITYLWHAYNHRQSLLTTILIHNWSGQAIDFENRLVHCLVGGEKIATEKFSIPCQVPAHTSMPWTFIFPKEHVRSSVDFSKCQLIVENNICRTLNDDKNEMHIE
ncbi:SLAP domain-containing protein [Pseudogracilibacillus sp. SE30717A]|uniref:SLAP domain-containing protein n=1 Tax=Pseudogracilibacillus sp. SE30717A TaxID=3098293 RepID=UPI00300DE119